MGDLMSFLTSDKKKYESEIELGRRYKDTQTGIEGVATGITFYQYSCERVCLETVIAGKIEEYYFDTARVIDVETQVRATTDKTGGPMPVPRPRCKVMYGDRTASAEFMKKYPIGTRLTVKQPRDINLPEYIYDEILEVGGTITVRAYRDLSPERLYFEPVLGTRMEHYSLLPESFEPIDSQMDVRGTIQLAIQEVLEGSVILDNLADTLLESVTQALNNNHNLR